MDTQIPSLKDELYDLIYEYVNGDLIKVLLNRHAIWGTTTYKYLRPTKTYLFDIKDEDTRCDEEYLPSLFFDQNIVFYGLFNEMFGNISVLESEMLSEFSSQFGNVISEKITYRQYTERDLVIYWYLEKDKLLFYINTKDNNKLIYQKLLNVFDKYEINSKLGNFLYVWFSPQLQAGSPSFNKNFVTIIRRRYYESCRSGLIDFVPTKHEQRHWKKFYPISNFLSIKNIETGQTSIYMSFNYYWVIDQKNYYPITHEFYISPIKIDLSRLSTKAAEVIKRVINKFELNTISTF